MGAEIFGSDPEDELLYSSQVPGGGYAEAGFSDLVFDMGDLGEPVDWIYAPVDRPHWASGDRGLDPRDYSVGGDVTPRWLGLSPTPASRSGWPRRDPPNGAPGDVFDMDPSVSARSQGLGESAATGLARQFLGTAVQEVVFKSQFTPEVTYQPFAPPGQRKTQTSGNPVSQALMKAAKPAFYLRTPVGLVPVFEPYGAPTADYSGLVAMGATVLGLTAAWLGWKAIKKLVR